MQVSVTLSASTPDQALKLYSALAIISRSLSDQLVGESTPTMKLPASNPLEIAPKAKRGPKAKTKIEIAPEADDDFEDEDDDELAPAPKAAVSADDDEDDDDLDEEDEDAEPAPRKGASAKPGKAPKPSKLTIEGDIIPAMIAYTKKHDREKAAKLLKKFGAKNVRGIPVDKYPELLAAARA